MIRLSTKGRYGTRLMLNLASRYKADGDAIILKSISEEEGISIRYLEQIIIPLKINKLVKSIRGAGGGYTLAKDPSRINLREILHALEGTCCLVECVEEAEICEREPYLRRPRYLEGGHAPPEELFREHHPGRPGQDRPRRKEKKSAKPLSPRGGQP